MTIPLIAVLLGLHMAVAAPATIQSVADMKTDPAGSVEVQNAWARPTPKTIKTGAVYLTIVNHGADDRLTSVSTPAATTAAVHEFQETGGVMQMRPVPAVEVRQGATVQLQPLAMHVMLEGLTQPLQLGQSFPMTLHFEKAGDVAVTVSVKLNDDAGAMHGMKM